MMKKAAIILLLAVTFAFESLSAKAQFPGHFGATRAPALDVDKSDSLFLMMSVATKPAGENTPGSQIFFTVSRDGGASWDNLPLTRNLSKSPGEAFGPALAVFKKGKSRAYTVYHDNSNGTTQAYLISSKKGVKFKKPQNITDGDHGAFAPRVALDSIESVNVVWGDTRDNRRQVFFLRSTDQGTTFGQAVDISRSSGEAFEPEIAVDQNDAINIAWEDTAAGGSAIMFSRSTDGGQTFSAPKRVSPDGAGEAFEAHIATDNSGNIHITWVSESEGDLRAIYSRSTDGGQTFSAPIEVSEGSGSEVHKPLLTTFRNTIYIAFHTEGGRKRQVFLAKSTDGGVSFGEPAQVSQADNSKGRGHSPAMVADSKGTLHLVWIDTSIVGNDEGLLLYRNLKNGNNFSAQQVVVAALP
jgi:BNR repeat protein